MPRHNTKAGTTRPRTNQATVSELFQTNSGFRNLPGLMMVKRDHIHLKPQVRQEIDDKEIRLMRENISQVKEQKLGSIEDTGILQALLVTAYPDRPGHFWLEAGHRRFLATGDWDGLPVILEELPCVLIETSARPIIQLIENVQRLDLPPGDEALGVVAALRAVPMTQAQLADLLGKTRGWIENRVKLGRRLDPESREYQEDLALWLPLHKGKKGASLSNLILISGVSEPRLRARLFALAAKDATHDDLSDAIEAAKPKDASGGSSSSASSGSSKASTSPTTSGSSSSPTFFGQSSLTSDGQTIEIGPSSPGQFSFPDASAATTAPSPAEGQEPNEGQEPSARALKDHIYPANQMYSLGIKLLEQGELEQVTEAELREAVLASERRVQSMRELLRQKKSGEDATD